MASIAGEPMTFSFAWLLEPVTPEAFFEDTYERQPLLIARSEPCRYAALLSLASVDRFLATTSPCHPDVFLVDAACKLGADDYTLAEPEGAGQLDLPRAYELFRSGATISIRRMHESLPELAALCRAMEKAFSAHFQSNIYLSPPQAQGFGTHFDSHDVFVLQVAGSKVWTLYDTAIELPLHGQGFDKAAHQPGPPTREIVLRAGDLFYCPRGLFHSARATEEISLHITLGLIGKTWADVIAEAVSVACLASPAFRANLPAGFANPDFDRSAASATFHTLVQRFAREADLAPILEQLAQDFVASRRPDFAGMLQEVEAGHAVTADTRLAVRPHLIWRLKPEANQLTLLFGASRLSFPAVAAEPLRVALGGEPFRVGALPGRLDDAGKIVLARRLLREGLLLRCP
jgi:JmjC domain